MLCNFRKFTLLALITIPLTSAADENEFKVGVEYSNLNVNDGFNDLNLTSIDLTAGIKFNDYFEIEGVVGFGAKKDSKFYDFLGSSIDFRLDEKIGVYSKFYAPFSETLQPYLIFGYTQIDIAADPFGSYKESDFSYGVGMDLLTSDNISVSLEYINLIDNDYSDANALNLGLSYSF